MELKKICYEWFNETSRADWNDWDKREARLMLHTYGFPSGTTAQELYETMRDIIAEYDTLNRED